MPYALPSSYSSPPLEALQRAMQGTSASVSLKVQDPLLLILTSAPIKQISSSQGAGLQYVPFY